jgi:hypothetical protein
VGEVDGQGGLADAGGTADGGDDHRPAARGLVQQPAEGLELVGAAGEVVRGGGQLPWHYVCRDDLAG